MKTNLTRNEFNTVLVNGVEELLGSNYRAVIKTVTKNNGVKQEGLSIVDRRYNSNQISPIIYLEELWSRYCDGIGIDAIVKDVQDIFEGSKESSAIKAFSELDIANFEEIRDRIGIKLVSRELNARWLRNCPYAKFLNLAITYQIELELKDESQSFIQVTYDLFNKWNIGEEELRTVAFANYIRNRRPIVTTMEDVITALATGSDKTIDDFVEVLNRDDFDDALMWFLSDDTQIYGAAAILYPGVLKSIAERVNSDLIILPSSVHEVLLVRYSPEVDLDEVYDMVKVINQTEVDEKDVLEDTPYIYRRATDKITLV